MGYTVTYREVSGLVCVKLFRKIYDFVASKDMWTCYECGMNKERTREDNSTQPRCWKAEF